MHPPVRVQEVSEDVDAWSSASSDAGFGADDNDSQFSDSDDHDQLVQLDANYDPSKETFAERIAALKDMVSPTTRQHIASAAEATTGWVKWSLFKAGNVAWIATTSALLVGLPLLLSIEGEAALVQQEKEYLAQPGAQNPYGVPAAAAGPGAAPPAAGGAAAPQGLVPAGF